MTTPHFRFKPGLHRLADGRFLAMLGHIDDLDHAICGVGATVEEAMAAFDKVCETGVTLPVAQHLQNREAALDAGVQPEPFPRATISPEPETKPKKKKSK
jgi:hypothetical protein